MRKEERLDVPRIGSGAQAIEWLIDFAQLDLGMITPGRWEDLKSEFLTFAVHGSITNNTPKLPGPTVQALKWFQAAKRQKFASDPIVIAQKTLQLCLLNPLLEKRPYPRDSLTFRVVSRISVEVGKIDESIEGDPSQTFLLRAARLLQQYAALIHRCNECRRIFVAYRPKQQYCSARCLGRVTQRRFKENAKKQRASNQKRLRTR
jgi:hypothetical protein